LMSGASGEGIEAVLDRLADAVGLQASEAAPSEEAAAWSPL
jgi:hypothetical protein